MRDRTLFKAHEIDPKILAEAVDWYMLHSEHVLSDAQQHAFDLWKNQSQQHQLAWQRVEKLQQRLHHIPHDICKKTLEHTTSRLVSRGKLLLLLTGGAILASTVYMADQQAWMADHRTPYGQQRSIVLEDGTQLMLNSKTAVDIHYTAKERQVILHYGEIFIETAKESSTQYRPFKVLNKHGSIQALGTQFNVIKHAKSSTVTVLEHAVKIDTQKSNQSVVLKAGQQITFNANTLDKIQNAEFDPLLWRKGLIVANRIKLKDFAAQLSKNYGIKITPATDVEDLLISGTYPTDNLERILKVLHETYALQTEQNLLQTKILINKN